MIGILNAYEFDPAGPSYQKNYTQLMEQFVKKTFPEEEFRDYRLGLDVWPKSVEECDLWFITGSSKSAYDSDSWIRQLQKFVVEIHQKQCKLVAICFGHQILAQALGGKTEKSPKGWGVGIRSFAVTSPQVWMRPRQSEVALLFSHQDQVVKPPLEAQILASNDFCPFQMMQIGKHIISMQGHPEFTVEFARNLLAMRQDKMPAETYQTAMDSFSQVTGNELMMRWIREWRSMPAVG